MLESSTVVTNKLRQELAEVRSQLEQEKTRGEELWEELSDTEESLAEVRAEKSDLEKTCAELRSEVSGLEEKLAAALAENKKSAPVRKDFPDAADLLNQLKKAKGKKFTASLADVESILEIMEES